MDYKTLGTLIILYVSEGTYELTKNLMEISDISEKYFTKCLFGQKKNKGTK